MKLAFIGIGNVGYAIANRLEKKGFEILIGHDNPDSESVEHALAKNPDLWVVPVQEAVDKADVVFLAVPFDAVSDALKGISFHGKTLIDCTNPIHPGLKHGLESKRSGSEMIQELAPDAKVVKSFTIYGFENLIDPEFPAYNVRPVMMIAGNDLQAKEEVRLLNDAMGFETLDTGTLDQALHLEHMTLLWVKMVRMNGHQPHLVWAKLEK
ncbi:MAG: NADPH-dependent F420 reductase [Bacteroidales bacterium]